MLKALFIIITIIQNNSVNFNSMFVIGNFLKNVDLLVCLTVIDEHM